MKKLTKAAHRVTVLGAGIALLGVSLFVASPAQAGSAVCGQTSMGTTTTSSTETDPMCGAGGPGSEPPFYGCPVRDYSTWYIPSYWCP
ncbi:hypothetical protein [Psychromicrobium xiongbiense]|uniref:hypothetical protein n=1 Tax=Psychromicrobium xiongbiense TaxID=3051184 RepID=UPI002553F16F|nr:hypothetical protein [Psychromicrobium sp. YIM S02556]